MMLTADHLHKLAKSCGAVAKPDVVNGIVANQNYLVDGGINSPGRLSEFLAQACIETDYFKTLREYASGAAYEGRADLGNTVAGDGRKFKGRGIFQCTGRANYRTYGKRLGVDLIKEPELAARPDISVRLAVLYWNDKGLNAYADAMDSKAISRAINRGSATSPKAANHEADRVRVAKLARSLITVAPAPAETAQPVPAAGVVYPPSVEPRVIAPAPPAPMLGSDPSIPPRNDGTFTAPASEGLWSRFLAMFRKGN